MFRVIHPNRYFFWAVALLVIFGIAAWGAVERWSIEEEIANQEIIASSSIPYDVILRWKTYRNEKYGFEIQYPDSWRVDTFDDNSLSIDGDTLFLQIYSYPEINSYNPGAPVPENEIKIEGYIYRNGKIIDELTEKLLSSHEVMHIENLVINGVVGKKIWFNDREYGITELTVYYADKGKGFSLTSWPSNSIYLDKFDQILSTFKFNEVVSSDDY